MTLKSRSALLTQANTDLPDNILKLISPEDVRNLIKDVIDSFISKSGDTGILGLLQYSNTFNITDGKQLIYRQYLDDRISLISKSGFLYWTPGADPDNPVTGDLREGIVGTELQLQEYDHPDYPGIWSARGGR